MGTMIKTGGDVVSFLKGQHEQVKSLFEKVLSSSGKQRAESFYDLRRMMAVHETAEEEIVHPAARKALPDGESIVRARLHEENEAKTALVALEALDVNSAEFEKKLTELQTAVFAHAKAEEEQEFAGLSMKLDKTRLERMKKAAELAESIAPTRAHPGMESQASNILAGPFVAMVDRSRDAISGKH